MAHQIVVTSVARGLDGVSGYQTVLKSQGIPPRVFDRLKARAGYSHPYSHGDPRNPVVYLHRIEELAGSRWHVLGCIRDAGSDHTGRSNFLAHMLAVEAGEARSKPGGPAAAAMAGGCFYKKWDGPPDGNALAKTLVSADVPPAPGGLPAWEAAGLDPGLAGDIAAAAMRNEKVVLVTRPGDDVLALFAEALRLVEPSKRWGVTFNTCAMEDFDGTWKAVRKDLVDAKNMRTGKAAVIDLTLGERGSEDPYAQFARGDKSSLPWQKVSRPVAAPAADPSGSSPPESTVPPSSLPASATARHVSLDTPPTGPSPARQRARRPRYIEEDEPSRVPWHFITTACLFLLIGGGGAAIFFREQLFGSTTPARPPVSARDRELAAELDLPSVVKPAPPGQGDVSTVPAQGGAIVSQQEASNQLAEKRAEITAQLKNGAYGTVRTQVSELRTKVTELKDTYPAEWDTLVTSDGKHRDPSSAFDQILQAFDELDDAVSDVNKVLGSRILAPLDELNEHHATLAAADEKVAVAAAGLDELQTQVRDLEADLCERQTENRQEEAFKDFQTLAKAVSLPAAGWQQTTDIGGPVSAASESKEIDLGPFRIADLMDLQVRLAVPRDLDEGDSVTLVNVNDTASTSWEIQYLKGAVGLDNTPQPPCILAALSANNGRLILKPAKLEQGLGSLLRRCVLLIEARRHGGDESTKELQAIRLVQPASFRAIAVDLLGLGQALIGMNIPAGVSRSVKNPSGGNTSLALPMNSLRVRLEVAGIDPALNVQRTIDFSDADPGPATQGFVKLSVPLIDKRPEQDLLIHAAIGISLPEAKVGVRTEFDGRWAQRFGSDDGERKENIRKRLAREPDVVVRELEKSFGVIVSSLPASVPGEKWDDFRRRLDSWFAKPLMLPINSGMAMPGHETMRGSFSMFLDEKRMEADEADAPSKWPNNYEAFVGRLQQVRDEKQLQERYVSPVRDWARWFWPKYEAEWRNAYEILDDIIAKGFTLRVSSVVSLAYDENGEEYEVPLVVLDESAAPVDGPASSGGGTPVGLD